MSGTTPQKDTLVHNSLAHKLMFAAGTSLQIQGDLVVDESTGDALVAVQRGGFSITVDGARFILANLEREVLSHREVAIMKQMVSGPRIKKSITVIPAGAYADIL